jgi:biotin carboxyl carrier protein
MKLQRPSLSTVIWATAAVGAAVLYTRVSPDHAAIPGVVEVPRHTVGAPIAGRVRAVLVKPGQAVAAGDVLATLEAMSRAYELWAVVEDTVRSNVAAGGAGVLWNEIARPAGDLTAEDEGFAYQISSGIRVRARI